MHSSSSIVPTFQVQVYTDRETAADTQEAFSSLQIDIDQRVLELVLAALPRPLSQLVDEYAGATLRLTNRAPHQIQASNSSRGMSRNKLSTLGIDRIILSNCALNKEEIDFLLQLRGRITFHFEGAQNCLKIFLTSVCSDGCQKRVVHIEKYTFTLDDASQDEVEIKKGTGFLTSHIGAYNGAYNGTWDSTKRHGHGILIFGPTIYAGGWCADRRHGHGIMMITDGERYEGGWQHGLKHGRGTLIEEDGSRYEGMWEKGNPNGRGIKTYSNDKRYEGEWKDGKPEGQGTLTYKNGKQYVGEFFNGYPHGDGVVTTPEKVRYQGKFVEGKRHGFFTTTFPNGDQYEEFWIQGKREEGSETYIEEDQREEQRYEATQRGDGGKRRRLG